jgi:site-specific recombinase XerD
MAPLRPLVPTGLAQVVKRRLRALGLNLPHYGPHVLRHACATRLLAQGLSLKEVGDHLGHQSPETTRIYAKVDLAALRAVGDFNLEGLL